MNFLLPPAAPRADTPSDCIPSESAQKFLNRIDALDEVTHIHHIWHRKHPDDHHTSIEELKDEIFAAEHRHPISKSSKSGTLRELADKYERERIANKMPKWNGSYTPKRIYLVVRGFYRLVVQIFRIPLIFLLLFLIPYLFFSLKQPDPMTNELSSTPAIMVRIIPLVAYLFHNLYVLFYDDEVFARACFGAKSKVRSGLYVHSNDTTAHKILKQPAIKEILNRKDAHPTGWYNGDLQTLIPVLLYDTIDLNLPYIRRHVRNPLDSEAIAIDIAFPYRVIDNPAYINAKSDTERKNIPKTIRELYFDSTKSILILHHGLNGSSKVSHLQAQVEYWGQRGHTCIAINVRGYGGSFVIRNLFGSGRLSDLEQCIKLAHVGAGNNIIDGLDKFARKSQNHNEPSMINFENCFKNNQTPMDITNNLSLITTPICAVGFSLGGIILAHYCCRKGNTSGLISCLSVSAIAERHFGGQTERDWDPILMDTVKNFVSRSEPVLYSPQIGEPESGGDTHGRFFDFDSILGSDTIPQFDAEYSYKVHGVHNFEAFCGDIAFATNNKLDSLVTKLLVIHPENDPIVHVDNLYPAVQLLLPREQQDTDFIVNNQQQQQQQRQQRQQSPSSTPSGKKKNHVENLVIYVPKFGGHIGFYPKWNDKWAYLSEVSYAWNNNAIKVTINKDDDKKVD